MNIIKGKHAVLEALKSDTLIDRIIVSFTAEKRRDYGLIFQMAQQKGIHVQKLSDKAFSQTANDDQAQGILAYVMIKSFTPLDHIIDNMDKYPFIIALDHIQDPYNFGSILRTCEVFGGGAVIFPKNRNCQLTPGVIKASSGAVHYLDLVRVVNVGQALEQLSKAGYWIYGTDLSDGVPLPEATINAPMVLVMGNEAKGQSRRLSKIVDQNLHIPMPGRISSLNVSVAAGILSYTLMQQIASGDQGGE